MIARIAWFTTFAISIATSSISAQTLSPFDIQKCVCNGKLCTCTQFKDVIFTTEQIDALKNVPMATPQQLETHIKTLTGTAK